MAVSTARCLMLEELNVPPSPALASSFASEGHSKATPLSMWESPFGPVGHATFTIVRGGLWVMDLHKLLMTPQPDGYGFGTVGAAAAMGVGGIAGILIIALAYVYFSPGGAPPTRRVHQHAD